MVSVDSFEQFKSETDGYNGILCLLFTRQGSPPCLVMERLLSTLCDKYNIKLFLIDSSNSGIKELTEKHGIGVLPNYVFLKQDKKLYNNTGTQPSWYLDKILRKLR